MPDDRLNMRLDPATKHDLEQLAKRMNLGFTSVVRLLLRQECERRSVPPYEDERPTPRPPGAADE